MKKTTFLIIGILLSTLTFAQSNNTKLIELGKIYKDFMFRNEPNKEVIKEAKANVPNHLNFTTDFIVQTITTKNKLLTTTFLSRPDDKILKDIYIIRAINLNLREENQIDNNKLIDSLLNKSISNYELIDNYYNMLFTGVGNKNQPFDLSKIDIKLKDYNLKDDTEKGILFLSCMNFCGKTIWGFMNVVNPPNTKNALENIKKYPKFNGQPYYQYTDFYFTDFDMIINDDKGLESYKGYYIDKYYEVLISHLICLGKENATEKEKNDLLLGSILKEQNLYKFSKYKETLEDLFEVQKRD